MSFVGDTERTMAPTDQVYCPRRWRSLRAVAVGGMLGLVAVTMTGCTKRHTGAPRSALPSGAAAAFGPAWSTRILFAGHGIEILTLTDAQDERSPALYATTDAAHWQLITPPGAATPAVVSDKQPLYDEFISASFLNTLTGWVVACDQSSGRDVIYKTGDGGHTWQTVLDGGADRCMVSVQLLALGVAILDQQTNGYAVGVDGILDLTEDDGKSWQSLFSVPEGVQLPQVTPVNFSDQQDGFSASGFIPFTNIGSPAFWASSVCWTPECYGAVGTVRRPVAGPSASAIPVTAQPWCAHGGEGWDRASNAGGLLAAAGSPRLPPQTIPDEPPGPVTRGGDFTRSSGVSWSAGSW